MAVHVHISPGGGTIGPLVVAVLRQSHAIIINQSINQSIKERLGVLHTGFGFTRNIRRLEKTL
jgi:hypothetical protein